jgi:hypothetical protein
MRSCRCFEETEEKLGGKREEDIGQARSCRSLGSLGRKMVGGWFRVVTAPR